MPKLMKGGKEYPLPPANNASNIAYKNGTVESALDGLNLYSVGVYTSTTRSDGSGLAFSTNFSENNALLGFEVFMYGQWRSGVSAGSIARAGEQLVFINDNSESWGKPIRVYYLPTKV